MSSITEAEGGFTGATVGVQEADVDVINPVPPLMQDERTVLVLNKIDLLQGVSGNEAAISVS